MAPQRGQQQAQKQPNPQQGKPAQAPAPAIPPYTSYLVNALAPAARNFAAVENSPYQDRVASDLAGILDNLGQHPSFPPPLQVYLRTAASYLATNLSKAKEVLTDVYKTLNLSNVVNEGLKKAGNGLLAVLASDPSTVDIIAKSSYQSSSKTYNQIKKYLGSIADMYKRLFVLHNFGGAPPSKDEAIDLFKKVINASDMSDADKKNLLGSIDKYVEDPEAVINNLINAVIAYVRRNIYKAAKEDSNLAPSIVKEITSDPYNSLRAYGALLTPRG